MLEIFTKDALCLRFLNTLLTLAWRAPDIGEFLSRMMEIANSHSKVNELNGWRIINNPSKSDRTSFVRITVARVHSLINTHRVWMLWTRGVEGLEAGDGKQKWIFRCAAKDVGMILYTTRTRVLLVSSHGNPFCFESCNMCSKQLLPGQIWFPSPDIIGI